MDKANPVLYTVPGSDAGTDELPNALHDAFLWQWFWWEVGKCGPDGAVRWRITEGPQGRLVVTNLADEEQVSFLADSEEPGRDIVQDQLLMQQGDNLVIVHIDEKQLRTN